MADDKKSGDKPAAPPGDPFVDIVWWIICAWIIVYFLNYIFVIINAILAGRITDYPLPYAVYMFFAGILPHFWTFIQVLAIFLSIGIVAGIIYLFARIKELRLEENRLLYPEIPAVAYEINPAWLRILQHADSTHENDWRLAILEADIILGTLLENMQLPGETMGEKLKAVERSDFTTIDNAWEAHKIRNQIAHEGASFPLNQREAKRVIALYQTVFEEFMVI